MGKVIIKYRVAVILCVFILISNMFIISNLTNSQNIVQASSTWKQTTESDFTSGNIVNLSIIKDGINERIRLESIESSLWKNFNLNYNPGLRKEHAMATIYGTDKVLLFGGDQGGWWWWNTYDSTWLYDHSQDKWEEIYPINHPGPRVGHAMSTIDGTDKILLFGGSYSSDIGETWIYDLSDNNWAKINPFTKPSARFDHAMSSIPGTDKVLLFGGTTNNNQTWIYDLSDGDWIRKYPLTSPSGREKHGMAQIDGKDKILLFGSNNPATNNETWIYDYNDNNWELVINKAEPIGTSNLGLTTIYGTDNIVLFGGTSTTSDTWVYDYSENTWSKKSYPNPPNNRYSHSLASIYGTNSAVLFGGLVGGSYNNITWIYDYNTFKLEGKYESAIYDTNDLSEFNTINWNCIMPNNTKMDFQIRTAKEITKISTKDFIGPNGSTTSYYSSSPADIWKGHYGDRWIQYRILFFSNDTHFSPILENVTIFYNCLPHAIIIVPSDEQISNLNKPLFSWSFDDKDSSSQSAFQILIDNESTFNDVDYNSSELYSSNEFWQFPNGTSYTEIPDGKWFWKISLKDNDGGWGLYSPPRILFIDTQSPFSSISTPEIDGIYNEINIAGTSSDQINGVGVNKVDISIKMMNQNMYWNGTKWVSNESWLLTTGTALWSFDSNGIDWISGNEYIMRSRAIDNASNVEIPGEGIQFIIDFESPFSIIEYPESNSFLNSISTISGVAVDTNGTGIDRIIISIKRLNDSKYWDEKSWESGEFWLETEGIDSWLYDSSQTQWSTDTNYEVYSKAIDNAGNIEIPSKKTKFMFDDTPPSINFLINQDDKYTNTTEVVLSLDVGDGGSGPYQMQFSTDNITWSDWEDVNTTKDFSLYSIEGEIIVYARSKDLAGNIAIPDSDTIILDTKPPKDLTIIINDGATETNSTLINLDLSAFDENSGVSHMSFSLDNRIWSGWLLYDETFKYLISHGDGEKILYYRVKDNAGNVAEYISETIILNTTVLDVAPDDDDIKPDDKDDLKSKNEPIQSKGISNMVIILVVIVIFIVIIVVIFFIIKRKKSKGLEMEAAVNEVDEGSQLISKEIDISDQSEEITKEAGEKQTVLQPAPISVPQPAEEPAAGISKTPIPTPTPSIVEEPTKGIEPDGSIQPESKLTTDETKHNIDDQSNVDEVVELETLIANKNIGNLEIAGYTKPVNGDIENLDLKRIDGNRIIESK